MVRKDGYLGQKLVFWKGKVVVPPTQHMKRVSNVLNQLFLSSFKLPMDHVTLWGFDFSLLAAYVISLNNAQ